MKPLGRIAAQRAPQDLFELTRHIASLGIQRRHIVRGLAGENLLRGLAGEGRTAEEREVDRGGERIEVRALVHALAEQLLRRGELRRPAARGRAAEARATA